jgi:hypothetical protein
VKRFLIASILIAIPLAARIRAQEPPSTEPKPPAPPSAPAPVKAPLPPEAPAAKTSEEFSAYTYVERSGEFTLLVYSWPARWRTAEKDFPLLIALGRADEKRPRHESAAEKKAERQKEEETVTIQLTDFELTDAQGNRYAPVPNEQIQREYKYLMADKHMLASQPVTTTGLFPESDPLSAAFYPVDGGGRFATLAVPMENYTSFQSTVYFPSPKGGFDGILSLTLKNPRLEGPITVRFKIPLEKGKKSGEAKKPAKK